MIGYQSMLIFTQSDDDGVRKDSAFNQSRLGNHICYPALVHDIYTVPLPPRYFFLLHTYLVEATAIKKAVCYHPSPALHIAAVVDG